MLKRLVCNILTAYLLLGSVCAQTVSNDPAVQKCNRVMRNIYVDILSIKSTYKELECFTEAAYNSSSQSISSIKIDSGVTQDTDGIRYNMSVCGCDKLGINIHYSWQSCIQGCLKTPTLEIRIGQTNNYLAVYLDDLSPRLTSDLVRIIKKNAVDLK